MNIFDFFKLNSKKTAHLAKERLQIVVSHQRIDNNADTDFMPKLRQELIAVISKYINVDPEKINVQLQKDGACSVLEMNVALPHRQ